MFQTLLIAESQHGISEFIPHFWNSELELYLEMHIDTVLSKVKYHLYRCTCAYLLFLYQRKVYYLPAHILSSSKVLHHRKRSSFIIFHWLFLVKWMYWCSQFKHGIGLGYFGRSNCWSGISVSQRELIGTDCLVYDLRYPFIPVNFCGKKAPWILVWGIGYCCRDQASSGLEGRGFLWAPSSLPKAFLTPST